MSACSQSQGKQGWNFPLFLVWFLPCSSWSQWKPSPPSQPEAPSQKGTCRTKPTETARVRPPARAPHTWGSRDTQHLLTELCKHFHRVSLRLGVQRLVHLGQDNLTQVEQPCSRGGGRELRPGGSHNSPQMWVLPARPLSPNRQRDKAFHLTILTSQVTNGPLPCPICSS